MTALEFLQAYLDERERRHKLEAHVLMDGRVHRAETEAFRELVDAVAIEYDMEALEAAARALGWEGK